MFSELPRHDDTQVIMNARSPNPLIAESRNLRTDMALLHDLNALHVLSNDLTMASNVSAILF